MTADDRSPLDDSPDTLEPEPGSESPIHEPSEAEVAEDPVAEDPVAEDPVADRRRPDELGAWLTQLQRQSWELELLITGFSIFLLMKTPVALDRLDWLLGLHLGLVAGGIASFSLEVLKVTVGVLIFNLVVHVVLRGVWIGFVGLSSVFPGGIRFDRISYRPRFVDTLRRHRLDQGNAIVRIDQVSSTIFSFSFLIAGYMLSATLGFIFIALAVTLTFVTQDSFLQIPVLILSLAWILISLLGAFDFVTAGALRRIRLLERPWSWAHRVLSLATLSFVYRPIYYILATNYRRSVVHAVVLLYLASVAWLSTSSGTDTFRLLTQEGNTVGIRSYDSLRPEKQPIRLATIPAPVVSGSLLPVFVRHDFEDSSIFDEVCGPLPKAQQPKLRILGMSISFSGNTDDEPTIDPATLSRQALDCFQRLYRFKIDHQIHQPEMLFHRHPAQKQYGLMTFIPMGDAHGPLSLKIETRTGSGPDDWRPVTEIPFARDRQLPARP